MTDKIKISLSKIFIWIAAGLCPLASVCQNQEKGILPFSSVSVEKGSLVFFVIGDWGRNGEYNQKEVANAMKKCASVHGPDFVVSTGDNFYSDGVASVQDPQWNSSFENIYSGNDLQIDWFVVLGNHDYHGNPQAEVDYSKISRRWRMPSRYFTNTFGLKDGKQVRFIYLDTNPFVKKYHLEASDYSDIAIQDTARQMRWLDSVLAVSKDDWKIVVGHHPVYSSSKKHGNTEELIRILKPRLDKNKVQAYFCGHDHDLQHQKPKGSSVDYFLSGAGSEVREKDVSITENTKFAKAIPGFAMVTIKDGRFQLFYIDKDLNVVYHYERGL